MGAARRVGGDRQNSGMRSALIGAKTSVIVWLLPGARLPAEPPDGMENSLAWGPLIPRPVIDTGLLPVFVRVTLWGGLV